MIPADLGAELAAAIKDLVAAGRLPARAAGLSTAGTWRPAPGRLAPDAVAGGAARYATSLPFELARLTGEEPRAIAAELGRAVMRAGWVASAEPAGAGYLTIGVTAAALTGVAVQISRAGASCMRSDALQSVSRAAPPLPDLAAPLSWRQAWRDQAAALAGRLAQAAGATAVPLGNPSADAPSPDAQPASRAAGSGSDGPISSTVAEAVAYAGADAVRYWLARMPAARAGLDQAASVGHDPVGQYGPPSDSAPLEPAPPSYPAPVYPAPSYLRDFAAVSFAAADAAATGRWAAELGLARLEPLVAGHLGQPAEIALLTELSWLAERVAGAARRRQPHELPRYLERLAGGWLDCRENCPALPFGGRAAPGAAAGISARLWLAEAAATALAAGLDLVGVSAVTAGSEHLS